MAAEDNTPEVVRISDVKRLDPSLTLKRNRSLLEATFSDLNRVVRNEELQTNLQIIIPLRDRGIQLLTVSHNTRDNVPKQDHQNTLFWSDYAALLLDLAAKFKKTELRSTFSQYAPTEVQLEEWAHAPNTEATAISEFTTWEHRYELAELSAKLASAFSKGVEEDVDIVGDETDTPDDTTDSTQEDEKAKLLQAALAAQQQQRDNATAAVPESAGADEVDASQLDTAELPENVTPEQAEKLSAAGISLQEFQQRYKNQQQLLIQFSIGQAARDRDIPISQLDPALIEQITQLANEFIENGDDFSFLFKNTTDRAATLQNFQNYLQRAGVPMGTFYTPIQALEQDIKNITSDSNPIVNKNVETTIDAIVISHGEKAVNIIDSFDKQKIELIFGFQGYNLSETQISQLKTVLRNYANYRLVELTVYTESEDTKKGLTGDKELEPEDSLALINTVRDTIISHSKDDDRAGELVADATTTTGSRTSKKIKFALEQNSKIFGSYWQSLTPEEQRVALTALGVPIPAGDNPTGYELPINIAELDPSIFRKYQQAIAERKQLTTELKAELAYAHEVNAYVQAAERAEALSLHMRNEYILQTTAAMTAAMHAQQALDEMSMYEMITAEESLMGGADGEALTTPTRRFFSRRSGSGKGVSKKLTNGLKKVAKNKGASVAKSEAAKKIAEKLAMGSGWGTAIVAGKKILDQFVDEETQKKILLALGGLSAGAIGAAIYRTIQLMQTVGGAIGGVVGGTIGFAFGGPVGALFGSLGGATAGANAQNWLMNLFGQGGGTTTTATTSSFSLPSFGGSASTASTASTATQTITPTLPSVPTPTPAPITSPAGAVNTIRNFTQTVTNAPTAAATTATTAVQTATVAATNIFTSLPAIVVGGSTLVPGLATIIVFLVIMGAFLAPMPFTVSKQEKTVSKYAIVNKKATPEEIENNVEEDISYEIEIGARTGYSLELKRVSDEFTILGGDATIQGESPVHLESFENTKITIPQRVNYTISMSGKDALVINTVTFVVDVYDTSGKILLQGESITTLALVIIGDPPIGCFEFAPAGITTEYQDGINTSEEWTKDDIIGFLKAFINRAGTNPQFLKLLCEDGDITLHKWSASSKGYWGYAFSKNDLGFYEPFFKSSTRSKEYTIVHESGHIIDFRNPGLRNQFNQIQTNSSCLTYPFASACNKLEAFAEGIADYIIWQTYIFNSDVWTGSFPFKTQYPVEYAWMRDNVFGGIEY